MNVYRIYPTLWNDGMCMQAQTVYAIDRASPVIKTACSHRPKEDPSYYWDNQTFQRLLPPENTMQPYAAVSWSTLPAWISWATANGYSVPMDGVKPFSDIFITGP